MDYAIYTNKSLLDYKFRFETSCAELARLIEDTSENSEVCDPDLALQSVGFYQLLWGMRYSLPEYQAEQKKLTKLIAADYAERGHGLYLALSPSSVIMKAALVDVRLSAFGLVSDEDLITTHYAAIESEQASITEPGNETADLALLALKATFHACFGGQDAAVYAGSYMRKASEPNFDTEKNWQEARLMSYLRKQIDLAAIQSASEAGDLLGL